jgi:hypothetical protein
MDEDSAIVNRLSEVIYFWGTALEIDPDKLSANNLEADVLMETSKRAWKLMPEAPLTTEALEPPEEADKAYPLMAAISGQFADAYKDEERPAWPPPQQQRPGMPAPPPPEEGPAPEITPAEGELILVGNAEMFRRDFLGGDSLNLFLNSVDTLTMGPELVQVRGKRLTNRAIETPSEGVQTFWMIVNFAAVPAVAIAIGVAVAGVRRARRTVYGQSHAA